MQLPCSLAHSLTLLQPRTHRSYLRLERAFVLNEFIYVEELKVEVKKKKLIVNASTFFRVLKNGGVCVWGGGVVYLV